MSQLPDVQNHKDVRGIKLQKVEVTNLYYPLVIVDYAPRCYVSQPPECV